MYSIGVHESSLSIIHYKLFFEGRETFRKAGRSWEMVGDPRGREKGTDGKMSRKYCRERQTGTHLGKDRQLEWERRQERR